MADNTTKIVFDALVAGIEQSLSLFVPGPDGLAVLGGFVAPRRDP